jgi:hypothetical protein
MSIKSGTEAQIKRAILDYLHVKGALVWINSSTGVYDPTRRIFRKPNSPYQLNGTSDILGLYEGRFLAIEVKKPKCYPSESQKRFIELVKEHGGIAFVARSVDDVINNLRQFNQGGL